MVWPFCRLRLGDFGGCLPLPCRFRLKLQAPSSIAPAPGVEFLVPLDSLSVLYCSNASRRFVCARRPSTPRDPGGTPWSRSSRWSWRDSRSTILPPSFATSSLPPDRPAMPTPPISTTPASTTTPPVCSGRAPGYRNWKERNCRARVGHGGRGNLGWTSQRSGRVHLFPSQRLLHHLCNYHT